MLILNILLNFDWISHFVDHDVPWDDIDQISFVVRILSLRKAKAELSLTV